MGDLLQSEGWERFQCALGRTTHRVDGVLAIEMPLPFGLRYLYAPRGSPPLRHCEEPDSSREALAKWEGRRGNLTPSVQRLARETDAVFWRAEYPDSQVLGVRCQVSPPCVLRRAVEPEWTWRTSLTESDTTRMAAMHEKHRYNMRLAERRGVQVNQYSSESVNRGQIVAFWTLLQDTARRQGIATHPRVYYETMLHELSPKPQAPSRKLETSCFLYLAEREGEPLAAAIVAYHGDTATYLHGGSSYEHRALMAPHLLHVSAMRDAKVAGMRWYDFGGIESGVGSRMPSRESEVVSREERPNFDPHASRLTPHASDWSGMTRFKMGFGGEAVHHPPTRDLVFRPAWYKILAYLANVRH